MTRRLLLVPIFLIACSGLAYAHVGTAGFVLLLPARYYILGAALAVAASFFLLVFLPHSVAQNLLKPTRRAFTIPRFPAPLFSLLSFALLVVLTVYGFTGTGDPFENPLPLFIWIVWWGMFTLVQVVAGELWSLFNPWTGVLWLVRGNRRHEGILTFKRGQGYWVAIVQFSIFVWIELVSTSAYDPGFLAGAVCLFWAFNLGGMLLFGERRWRAEAEPFSVFFTLAGSLSPFERSEDEETGRIAISFVWPGKTLVRRDAMTLSGSLFILLTLSTVSFDGLSSTFFWVSSLGLNPLDFPGRSAVTWPMTLGLAGAFLLLAGLFLLSVGGGLKLIARREDFALASGRLVYSILPISLVFHFAHYMTYLMVQGQYALKLASDPFGRGWDLFGTADWQVTTSFFYNYGSVLAIWNVQTASIVLGHIAGITMAHLIALDVFQDNKVAIRSQIFLAVLMVGYTAFGLWLLSSPKI